MAVSLKQFSHVRLAQPSFFQVEDAAILGNLFSRISHRSQIAPLLHAYQKLRYARTTETQASAKLNQKIFHLPDGPEQRARDDSMRAAMAVELGGSESGSVGLGNANQWADKGKNMSQFCYDADRVADNWWDEEGEQMVGRLDILSRM
jgi:salicylate hydroxylase